MRHTISWIVWWLEWAALISLGAVSYALDVTIPAKPEASIVLQREVEFVQRNPTAIGLSLVGVILVGRIVRLITADNESPEAKVIRRAVNRALDQFRKVAFPNVPVNVPQDHNRVTIFRYRPYLWSFRKWPWSGWLIMLERSGHLTKHGSTVFRSPDDPGQCEGVAGQAWRSGAIRVGGPNKMLPDLSGTPYTGYWKAAILAVAGRIGWMQAAVAKYEDERSVVSNYAQATFTTSNLVRADQEKEALSHVNSGHSYKRSP